MILVTGGTGTLGSDLVPELTARGHAPIILSRRPGPNTRVGDLATGHGLDAALEGIDTVVHLAVGRDQGAEARALVEASERAGVQHLVFISIPGIEKIPLPYYKAKLEAEDAITRGSVPSSILRATQFHQFVIATFFTPQRFSPVTFAPKLSIQPIDTRVVATALADLAESSPQGRVPDIGGPEILTGRELARMWSRKPVVEFRLWGEIWNGYAAGHLLVPENRSGGRAFSEFLAS